MGTRRGADLEHLASPPRTITKRKRAERVSERLSGKRASEREWRDGSELRVIDEAAQAIDDAETDLREKVRAARAVNCSWASIGAVLGVSKQAAQQRFG